MSVYRCVCMLMQDDSTEVFVHFLWSSWWTCKVLAMLHLRHSFTEQSVGELFKVCLNVKSPIQAALHQNGMRDTLLCLTYQLKDWILVSWFKSRLWPSLLCRCQWMLLWIVVLIYGAETDRFLRAKWKCLWRSTERMTMAWGESLVFKQ